MYLFIRYEERYRDFKLKYDEIQSNQTSIQVIIKSSSDDDLRWNNYIIFYYFGQFKIDIF